MGPAADEQVKDIGAPVLKFGDLGGMALALPSPLTSSPLACELALEMVPGSSWHCQGIPVNSNDIELIDVL